MCMNIIQKNIETIVKEMIGILEQIDDDLTK
mgnify:CR=1 FL=1